MEIKKALCVFTRGFYWILFRILVFQNFNFDAVVDFGMGTGFLYEHLGAAPAIQFHAFFVDAMFMLSRESVGPKKDAIKPSNQVLKLTLLIVLACLIIFSAIFLLQIYKTA